MQGKKLVKNLGCRSEIEDCVPYSKKKCHVVNVGDSCTRKECCNTVIVGDKVISETCNYVEPEQCVPRYKTECSFVPISRFCSINRCCIYKFLGKHKISAGCKNYGVEKCREICHESCTVKTLHKPHENCKQKYCCRTCETKNGIKKDKCHFSGEPFCNTIVIKKKKENCS